eukprot:tig00020848_g14555.t1
MAEEDRYAFIVEYYDDIAQMVRRYQLLYYAADATLEMYDLKQRRTFLKRCEYPSVRASDLHLGSTITVYSRQLKIVEYGDEFTKKKLENRRERTLAMIKPDAVQHAGKILDAIFAAGLKVANLKMFQLSIGDAQEFYTIHRDKPFYQNLVGFMTSGPVVAIEIVGSNVVQKWRQMIGPTSSSKARAEAPQSLRGQLGSDDTKNAVHGSDSAENAEKELNFFFAGPRVKRTTARFENCTLALIKPHSLTEGLAGKILDGLFSSGLKVTALEQFHLNKADAAEFFEVYKGVVPEFSNIVDEACTGPLIAVELCGGAAAGDAVRQLRGVVGPREPELAKALRPDTLRARYGRDKVRNAIHCTDLPEDGVLEVEYFWSVLLSAK